jgi:pimeloyl-ACP methyl ester carboxylesterase
VDSFTSFDGTRIAYSDEGEGPAVVLLHGFGLDGLGNYGPFDRLLPMLERVVALFREELGVSLPASEPPPAEGKPGLMARLQEAGARVIVPDLRGCGASDKPHETAAYADGAMARDVIALADHLGLDAFDVVGFSMGALTAARLLALGAPSVRSAILAGISQFILEGEVMDLPEKYPLPAHLPRPVTMRALSEDWADVLERGEVVPGNPGSANVLIARAAGADPRALAGVLRRGVAEPVSPEALGKVRVPVLVLNGRGDFANQAVGRLLEVMPTARSAACDGDHYTTPWYPSFQQAVVDFLQEQWRARGVAQGTAGRQAR